MKKQKIKLINPDVRLYFFFFQAEDGIRDGHVTGVQTCALPISGEIAGQTVAVTGCGPIGLMAIAVAKACGCSTVFATEVNPHRRALALQMGADERSEERRVGKEWRARWAQGHY